MRSIIKYFISHPTIVNLCLFLLVGMGALQLMQTKTTNFPKQRVRFLTINVPYPGASPTEVESGITIKIEENLEGIQGIDRVTSTSGENLSTILVELTEDSDDRAVLAEVKSAVDKVNSFPERAEAPIIDKIEIKDLALRFGIIGEVPLAVKKDYADLIENDLLVKPGISDVVVEGLPVEEIEIQIREADLQQYQLTFSQVAQAVRVANIETFGGEIKTDQQNITIKADNKRYYAKELQNIIVKADVNGSVIRLRDLADVQDRFADNANGRYYEGQDVVSIAVFALADEDILTNAQATQAYIDAFNAEHVQLELKVLEDGTVSVRDRIQSMLGNGIGGMLLVLLVLALFLDRYLAFWVALKIPIAIVSMFILAPVQEMTINVVSLFGFVIVLGILVDDGVVIGENIYQWARRKGMTPAKAALEGTMEMVVPVLISLSTTAVAFSLFFFLPTQAGEFFGEMGFVVVAVLIMAMIESFFFLPAHLAHSKGLRTDHTPSRLEQWFDHTLTWLRDHLYMPAFRTLSINKRWVSLLTIIGFVVMLVGAISLMTTGKVGFTFFPTLDDDAVFVELTMRPGTPVEVTQAKLAAIEEAVWETNKEFSAERSDKEQVIRYVEQITGPQPNQGKLRITFMGGETRGVSSFDLSNRMRELSPEIPEAESLIFGIGATSAVFGKPVSFALYGRNLEELRLAKDELKAKMQVRENLIKDVSDTDQLGVEQFVLRAKPEAELLGFSIGSIMGQVRAGFFGEEVQSLQRGADEVKVWVRYPRDGRARADQLMEMRIQDQRGNSYLLRDLVELDERIGTLAINHLDGQREIRLEANVANLNVSAPAVIGAIESEDIPDILEKYPSVSYSVEGQQRSSFKMAAAMGTYGPIILLFILGLIVLNFNSFSQAFLVFSLFPFALIGVILGHWLQDTALNVFSFVGTIALIGVFVNNSLVFISTLNQKLQGGISWREALEETAASRFRPILLTTVTTVAGLAPLLASNSIGAQFLKGPAIAIAYGLSFGLFNVLLLLPAMLHFNNGLRQFWFRLRRRKSVQAAEVEPAVRSMAYWLD